MESTDRAIQCLGKSLQNSSVVLVFSLYLSKLAALQKLLSQCGKLSRNYSCIVNDAYCWWYSTFFPFSLSCVLLWKTLSAPKGGWAFLMPPPLSGISGQLFDSTFQSALGFLRSHAVLSIVFFPLLLDHSPCLFSSKFFFFLGIFVYGPLF